MYKKICIYLFVFPAFGVLCFYQKAQLQLELHLHGWSVILNAAPFDFSHLMSYGQKKGNCS